MNQEQIYDNCVNYNTPECPHINDKLMKIIVDDIHISNENATKPFSRKKIITELFCDTCSSFKDRRI